MTINFTRLFTSEGYHCGALNELNTFRGTTLNTRFNTTLYNQYVATAVYDSLVSGLSTNLLQAQLAQNTEVSFLSSDALSVLALEVNADHPLQSLTLVPAVTELIRQMELNSQTLNSCVGTVSTSSVGSPVGDESFIYGIYDGTGAASDYFVPDSILVQCTSNASTGASPYQETFTLTGNPAPNLITDSFYGASGYGVGLSTTATATDPFTSGGLVQNQNFANFTSNIPNSWTLGSGVVGGTNIKQKVGDDPRGTGASNTSLDIISTGSVIYLSQQLTSIQPLTTYAVYFRVKKVSDPGSPEWAVTVRLVDGSRNAIAGGSSFTNSISSGAASGVASSWANVYTGQFVTPLNLPTTGVFLEVDFTSSASIGTAAPVGAECYFDWPVVIQSNQLYAGGPTLNIISGITQAAIGDTRTSTVAITTGTINGHLIRGLDRLLGLAALTPALRIPTSGSPTISDSLVT